MSTSAILSFVEDAVQLHGWQKSVTVLLTFAFVIFIFPILRSKPHDKYFRNAAGEHIQDFSKDTRFLRFTHGRELLRETIERFPTDPYLVTNGAVKELVIFNESHVREFFAVDGKDHTKKHDLNFGHYFDRMLGKCVGVQNGETWHTMRRHMNPHVAFSTASSMVASFQTVFQQWATNIGNDSMVAEKTDAGFYVDGLAACRQLPFKLISMALYGNMLTDEVFDRLWDLNTVHETITHSAFLEKLPTMWFYRWLPTKQNRAMEKYETDWKALNTQIISEARKTKTTCPIEEIYRGVEVGDMTMTMFLQSVDEILFTNIDVTSSMFACALISLGRTPNVQSQLRDEILLNSTTLDKAHAYVQKEDTLLHKTYLETLRINPPIWYSLPEVTYVDKYISGFLIPAGTSVITDVNRLNKLSPIWGADGHVFRPARFEKLSGSQVRYSMHGYGMGPRKCLGKNFANLLIKMLIATILKEYNLVVKGEQTEVRRDRFTCTPEEIVFFSKRGDGV